MDKGFADLVDCSVAAYRNYYIVATESCLTGKLGAMTGIFSLLDGICVFRLVQILVDKCRDARLADGAGNRIQNECYVLHRVLNVLVNVIALVYKGTYFV